MPTPTFSSYFTNHDHSPLCVCVCVCMCSKHWPGFAKSECKATYDKIWSGFYVGRGYLCFGLEGLMVCELHLKRWAALWQVVVRGSKGCSGQREEEQGWGGRRDWIGVSWPSPWLLRGTEGSSGTETWCVWGIWMGGLHPVVHRPHAWELLG